MPRYYSYKKGKKPVSRYRKYKKKSTSKKQIARVVRSMRETKYTTRDLETDFSSIPSDFSVRSGSGGIQLDLAGLITQGDSAIQRDGNRIFIKNIQFNGILALGDNSNITRILLVRAIPTLDLPYSAGAGSDVNIFTELGKPSDVDGIKKVMYDRKILLTTSVTQDMRIVKFNIPVYRYFDYKFGANTGDHESYFLYMVSDSSAVAHPGFLGGRVRVWFQDP